MKLKRDISKFNLLLLSIGSIVGSGWLFGSFYTAKLAGPAAIISWAIGGFFVFVIALTLAELSCMLPLAGGSTSYITITHGKLAGGIFAWITWLWAMIIAPIEVQAILQYASNYIPGVIDPTTHVLSPIGIGYAAILMLTLSAINMIGVKFMAETNKFIVFWKLIIPIAIALVLIFYKPHFTNLTASSFAPNGISGIFSSISNGGIAMSFFGFQTAIFLAGESKNPQKAIPFSLFGSILFCAILYIALQIGFILALDPSHIQNGWQAISFQGDAGPFAGIFITLGMVFMVWLLYFDAALSPFGTAIGYVASSSRILYSLSLQGDAPKFLAKVNKFSIPWITIVINFIVGMCLFLPFSGWQEMASFISAAIVVTIAYGPICLPIFRKYHAELERPFKLKYMNPICFFTFYICNLILHWTGWNTIWKLEVAVVIGLILQISYHFYKERNFKLNIKESLWVFAYLIISGVISYCGEFGGGKGYISMSYDFMIILVSSALIYYYARKSVLSRARSRVIFDGIMQNHAKQTQMEVHII